MDDDDDDGDDEKLPRFPLPPSTIRFLPSGFP